MIRATKILYNGKIFTSDSDSLWVSAVAIKRRAIIKTGTDEEVLALQTPETEVINLNGAVAIPGINEAHIHLLPYLANGIYINDPTEYIPGPGPSVEEILGLIQYVDSVVPKEQWFYVIVGENFIENGTATRQLIDSIVSDRPVIIYGWSGHYLLINTPAMQVAGISETEPDPFAGSYDRYDETDIVNGVCHDYAIYDYARRIRSQVPDEAVVEQLGQILNILPKLGVTTIQDIPIGFTSEKYAELLGIVNSPVRVRNIGFPFSIEESRNMSNYSGVKWILDGTEQESGMYLTEPYYDDPSSIGRFTVPLDCFDDIIQDSLSGFRLRKDQRMFHGNGDKTIDILINTMDETINYDFFWRIRRVRVEHGILVRPDHIPELISKGIVVVKCPTQFITAQTLYKRIGPVRFSQSQLLKTLINSGVNVALASDQLGFAPNYNPFFTLKMAVVHPTNPTEAITMEQAVIAHTKGASYAEFTDLIKGMIKPGQLADIAVLSQDIFNPVNIPTMEHTTSILTIIGGDTVWDAGIL